MSSRVLQCLFVWICVIAPFSTGCSLRDDGRSEGDVLFVREQANGDPAIFLTSDEGGDVLRLVSGDLPRWSPDGTRFAYSAEDERGGTSVWLMEPDTAEKRRIVSTDELVVALAWAPDGVRLAYAGLRRISVVNTETGASIPVSLDVLLDGPLDWSPDGRELLVSRTALVKVLDLRTGAERQVAPRRYVDGGKWSVDGERMAFNEWNFPYNSRRGAFDFPADGRMKSAIVVADRDGSSRQRVTSGAFDSEPAWSDDGGRIYFTRQPSARIGEEVPGSDIYAIDLETRTLERLTDAVDTDRSPDPRPARRSLPDLPEPATGDVLVPDLVGRHVLFEDERHRFRALGLKLTALLPFPELESWLFVVEEQVPRGGSRVPRGTVVKLDGTELSFVYSASRTDFSPERWKAHPGCEADSPRGPMYWNLVNRVLRKGMSRERLVSLLGAPGKSNGGSAAWPIGRLSVAEIACIYLRVEFARRGRVTRFYQSTR